MAAPYAAGDVELEIEGDLVSAPYVTMTLATMAEFGLFRPVAPQNSASP